MGQATEPKKDSSSVLKDFIQVFIGPALINKMFMLYFGLSYVEHPDEGYGYGLVATIVVFLIIVGRFLWKYRNVEDP